MSSPLLRFSMSPSSVVENISGLLSSPPTIKTVKLNEFRSEQRGYAMLTVGINEYEESSEEKVQALLHLFISSTPLVKKEK